jgi:hypothetical protein
MANWAHWVIPHVRLNSAGALELPMLVNGQRPEKPVTLQPDNGKIVLFVFHSEHDDLPPGIPKLPLTPKNEKPEKKEAVHFKAFYPLVGKSESEEGPIYQSGAEANKSVESIAGIDYMCIAATAPAAPRQP